MALPSGLRAAPQDLSMGYSLDLLSGIAEYQDTVELFIPTLITFVVRYGCGPKSSLDNYLEETCGPLH